MTDRSAVLTNWHHQLVGMDTADTALLASQFTGDATLTHMTSYVATLDEWMVGIDAREFVYHRVEEHSVDVQITGERAELVGHVTTGITDDGSGHAWPLTICETFIKRDGQWLCTSSRVSLRR